MDDQGDRCYPGSLMALQLRITELKTHLNPLDPTMTVQVSFAVADEERLAELLAFLHKIDGWIDHIGRWDGLFCTIHPECQDDPAVARACKLGFDPRLAQKR